MAMLLQFKMKGYLFLIILLINFSTYLQNGFNFELKIITEQKILEPFTFQDGDIKWIISLMSPILIVNYNAHKRDILSSLTSVEGDLTIMCNFYDTSESNLIGTLYSKLSY